MVSLLTSALLRTEQAFSHPIVTEPDQLIGRLSHTCRARCSGEQLGTEAMALPGDDVAELAATDQT